MRLKGKHELCLCEYHCLFPLIALINDVTQYACTSNLQIYLYNLEFCLRTTVLKLCFGVQNQLDQNFSIT